MSAEVLVGCLIGLLYVGSIYVALFLVVRFLNRRRRP